MTRKWQIPVLILFIALIAAAGWIIPRWPIGFVAICFFYLLILAGVVKYITSLSVKKLSFWWQLTAPFLFLLSGFLFYLFLNNSIGQRLFFLAFALILFVYIYNQYLFYQRPAKYQAFTLENFSFYLNFLSVFMLISSLYGLMVFLNMRWYLSLLFLLTIVSLVWGQISWIKKIDLVGQKLVFISYVLISLQSFFVIRVLPFSFYVLAFWFSAIWYLSIRFFFSISQENFRFRRYLWSVSFIFILALILTLTTRIY